MNKPIFYTGFRFSFLLMMLIAALPCYSQIKSIEEDGVWEVWVAEQIEMLAEQVDEEVDYSGLIEGLRELKEHPLHLNTATREELSRLVFLNDLQIYNLLAYRETYGNLVSLYELMGLEGYDQKTIQGIMPLVTLAPSKPEIIIKPGNVVKYGHHQILLRMQRVMEQRRGYDIPEDSVFFNNQGKYYLGSPERIYLRYGFKYRNKIRLGFTAEKDPGEIFLLYGISDSIKSLVNQKFGRDLIFTPCMCSLQKSAL